MSYELFIAKRYLRSNQRSGHISLIAYIAVGGVILGVAALTIMLSVVNGFAGEVKDRLIGMNAHVTVSMYSGQSIEALEEVLQRVGQLPEVVGASPVARSKVMLFSKRDTEKMDGVALWGVEPSSFRTVSDLADHLVYDQEGTMRLGSLSEHKYPGIILGEQLSRRLRVGPGDEILLVTSQNMDLEEVMMDGFRPRVWPFLVTDTFSSGMFQYDDSFAFIGLEDAQKILGTDGSGADAVFVRVSDIDLATQVKESVDEALQGYPYRVSDWSQIFPQLFQWMELEKWAIFIALSLIMLVAAFNIMSILVMSILVKTPEIGILRAMGSTAGGIRRIFVYQGLIIGLIGTVLGCAIGSFVCYLQQRFELITIPGEVYFISSLPVDMEWLDFLGVSTVSLIICLAVSMYSARKAAALMPVEAIRHIM